MPTKLYLREWRNAKGMTQTQVGARMKPPVSAGTISALENGRVPSVETLGRLADALGVKPATLFSMPKK